ncbi:MAG: 16S rRNA processing protein RimM [Candidatus Dormibacteraeota bacterium]|nr:16S rRNA processing protein RimM [Candidatus Dormibacteraeota bacterium]
MTPDASPHSLRAAVVRRAHGLRGEVRAEPLGGDEDRFRRGVVVEVEGTGRRLRVRSSRPGPDGTVLLGFDGVDTPEHAAALRGAYLTVGLSSARRLGDDEWFVWQIVGLRCASPDGADLGVVDDVESAPAADVLVIRSDSSVQRYPMVREFVRDVDIESGVITLVPQSEVAG